MRVAKAVVALIMLGACSTSTGPDLSGEPAVGVASRITYEHHQVAGGQPQLTVLTVDSASARWDEVTCVGGSQLGRCQQTRTRAGNAGPADQAALWQFATSAAFRALRATYGFPDGMVPPDGSSATLTVVANGRRWQVSYDTRAPLPAALARLDCRLRVVRGDLILCA